MTDKVNIVAQTPLDTVIAEYTPTSNRSDTYQSEAALEAEFIRLLDAQGYEPIDITGETALVSNLRRQLEALNIVHGDTLTDPASEHWDAEPFEAIVSNPPYSIKWDGNANPLLINDPRFSPAGVLAPKSKADMAFIMHALSWLAASGTAAIVCFPGIFYRSGAEQKIRQYLVDNNFVDCVIQLPDNLFFGTSIATCIMVLKRGKRENTTLFIDASHEFVKVTNSNKLTDANITKILTAYTDRADVPHFARIVPNDEIAERSYNLSVSTYVEQEDKREVIDIVELNTEIERIVSRSNELRAAIDAIIMEIEAGE